MRVQMTNKDKGYLSDIGEMDEQTLRDVNEKLKTEGTPNRYVKVMDDDSFHGGHFNCFFGVRAKGPRVKKQNSNEDAIFDTEKKTWSRKRKMTEPQKEKAFVIIIRNKPIGTVADVGWSISDAIDESKAEEIILKHLGQEMRIFYGIEKSVK